MLLQADFVARKSAPGIRRFGNNGNNTDKFAGLVSRYSYCFQSFKVIESRESVKLLNC
jgi:hypothetical protein